MTQPKCPVCGKPADPKFRPACSSRCSTIDLGRWLNGSYVVAGEALTSAADEEVDPELDR